MTDILAQIKTEYDEGLQFMKPRWTALGEIYKMLCNKTRHKDKISMKLMYTYYSTVLASMYSDTLKTEFDPMTEEDTLHCENIRLLAQWDYELMGKAQLDYEWLATTLIEGSSLLLMCTWDKKESIPKPSVIDGMSLIRDPYATSVEGNADGTGKLRYFGRYIFLTEAELDARFASGMYTGNKKDLSLADESGEDDRQRRDRLVNQGYDTTTMQTKRTEAGNTLYKLLEWFTYIDGKPTMFTTNATASIPPIRTWELPYKSLPVIRRVVNPIPGQWDGYSICELVEDFHRQMNVVMNGALAIQKAGAFPRYLVDKNKIENLSDLMKAHFNQYLFVDGQPQGVIEEMPRRQVSQDTSFVMGQLDQMAQRATATGDIQQGVQGKAYRSATEQALVQENSDTRYGLTAKVLTWSEVAFWRQWYRMVKKYYPSQKEKLIRLKGEGRFIWRPLTKDQINTAIDPDIRVVSFGEQIQERQRKLQALTMVSQELMMNPLADQQYLIKKKLELQGLTQDEIAKVFPPTVDQYISEMENVELAKNKPQQIHAQDDDYQHIMEHNKMPDTPAKLAHVKAHKIALLKKKAQPEMQQMSMGSGAYTAQEQTVKPNTPNLPRMDTPANMPHGNTLIA